MPQDPSTKVPPQASASQASEAWEDCKDERPSLLFNYHDHANDIDQHEEVDQEDPNQRRRGGVSVAFPVKHAVLDQVEADGLAHAVSWKAHGRCFVIHDPKEFVTIMPR
jgi:hypothetical protein